MKMHINPYLFFHGHCEEAFAFYAKVLGGKVVEQHRYADMPPQTGEHEGGMSKEQIDRLKDQIMHATLQVDDQLIMGSDTPGEEAIGGVKITLNFKDPADGKTIFDALSDGGTIEMPYQKTFWAEGFGMLTDKFGVPWMINAGDH